MKIEYGYFSPPLRRLDIPPNVQLRWACKRCQANGVTSTEARAERRPATQTYYVDVIAHLSEHVAELHKQASPGCKANILITLAAWGIKDV